jgi:hypothetical protein
MLGGINGCTWAANGAWGLTSARIAGCNVLALMAVLGGYHVDVDIALLHELAELCQPLGRVYFRHVDGAQGGGGVEGSGGPGAGQCVCDSYLWAPQQAREHV